MKLVNCHHVIKGRRRRPPLPGWRRTSSPATAGLVPVGGTGEELLKMMMMIAGVKLIGGGQTNCDDPEAKVELRRVRRRRRRCRICSSNNDILRRKRRSRTRTRTRRRQPGSDQPLSRGSCQQQQQQSSHNAQVETTRPSGDRLIVCRPALDIDKTNNNNRFKLFNRLLLYSTLMCLIVCNDSAYKLSTWTETRHSGLGGDTGPELGAVTPSPRPAGLILAASADPDANRLYEDLMMTYNRIVTPTRNASEKLIVRLGLKLSQLMDVNIKNQMMTINVWLNQEWTDYKLEWDPSEYGGIVDINLPAEQIWLPDIALYNSAEGYFAVSIMTKAKVRYDGYVIWNPPAIFRSSCTIDITHFPFDIQDCHLKFGSWTYGDMIDLKHVNETADSIERGTDLSEYYQNVEWDIMKANAKRETKFYECCPDPYYDITFHFKLRRKPLFYTVNLILPCVGITFFSFLVFYLPSDSGEKVTLTISILVSLIFFLSVLIETIPSTSVAMPLLGKYLVFTMFLITLSVCATVGVLNIHFRTPSTHSMPPWVKRWCMDVLPKYLFMSVPQYQQNTILPEQLIYLHNQAYANQAVTLPLKQPSIIAAGSSSLPRSNSVVVIDQHQHQPGSTCGKTCCPSSSAALVIDDVKQPSLTTTNTTKQFHVSELDMDRCLNDISASQNVSVQSKQVHELSAAHLLASNTLQAKPTAFLPYLQSEAARRLQLQRSRSSEKDTRSTSDNQPNSGASNGNELAAGTSGGDAKSDRLRDKLHDGDTNSASGATSSRDGTSDRKKKSRGPASNPIWRLFKPSKPDGATRDHHHGHDPESNREQQHNHHHQQRQQQHRNSHSSSSTSSQSGQHDHDDNDNYRHHRHFQARASICSNNLWRIGPTRRCSLAVPMVNYPSYYRPLAQLHQQRGSCSGGGSMLNTISGNSCLPPIVAHHHHHHINDGEDSENTTSSGELSQYHRDGAIGGLINRTATLAHHPERMFVDSQRAPGMHNMGPMTSGGFISINSQMQRGVNAIPPRRSITPSSFQSESQNNMPTPPPPLPPDFTESPSINDGRGGADICPSRSNYTQQQQQQQTRNPWTGSHHRVADSSVRVMQMNALDQDQESTSSVATTIQHPKYVPTNQAFYRQSNPLMSERIPIQQQHQQHNRGVDMSAAAASMIGHRSQLNDMGNVDLNTRCFSRYDTTAPYFDRSHLNNPPTSECVCQSGSYFPFGQQSSMPRSRSTGHRLSKLTRAADPSSSSDILATTEQRLQEQSYPLYGCDYQEQPNCNQTLVDTSGVRRQQYQSIGRQLGQAYIQRLQRQPAVYSMQHQSRTMLPLNRDLHGIAMTNLASEQSRQQQQSARFGGNSFGQARLPAGPSIDMLRRSKSQTSLTRKAAQGCVSSIDCRLCMAEGVAIINSHIKQAADQQLGTGHSLQRPHIERRGGLNSTIQNATFIAQHIDILDEFESHWTLCIIPNS